MEYSLCIRKQGCHSHPWFPPSKCVFLSPEGTQEGEAAFRQSLGCLISNWSGWLIRNSGCEKPRILAPDNRDTYERSDFREPRLLHLPIQRNALNSLTWDIWLSLIHNDLLTCRLPALSGKTSIQPGPSHCLLRAILLGLVQFLPPGLEVLKIHP